MKSALLGTLLLVAGLATPAAAQYYLPQGGPGYGSKPGYDDGRSGYEGRRGGRYEERRGGGYEGRRGHDGPRRGYDGPRSGYYDAPPAYGRRGGQHSRRASSVCVTSRGSCPIGNYVPVLTPCGCVVPGFGYKRGAAG